MRIRLLLFHALLALFNTARAGDVYSTGFESPPFTLGPDTIRNTDGWSGPFVFAGKGLSGIDSGTRLGWAGLGNVAYLGANPTRITGVSEKSVYVRRPVNLDPVALGQEVASFSVLFAIVDSTADAVTGSYRRDNFEFQIWNSDPTPKLLGGIQFDNNRLDSLTGLPLRSIYLLYWNGFGFVYTNTGYTFLAEVPEILDFRINFRTNRWTVSLGGAPLFEDIAFYTGPSARTLGSVRAQMQVTNTFPGTIDIYPGDNYMLFDDYRLRTDPVTVTLESSWTATGACKLDWNEEYGHRYRLQYSPDAASWFDFAETIHTATSTGDRSFTDTTSPRPARRFFRVRRDDP
jgi:hypothetical protein